MRANWKFLCMILLIALCFFLNIAIGTIAIPVRDAFGILFGEEHQSLVWQNIILKSRLPQALTAMVAGAGLAISGLQMQTVFRNPLAGPRVFGINSGAGLGVALVMLLLGGSFSSPLKRGSRQI